MTASRVRALSRTSGSAAWRGSGPRRRMRASGRAQRPGAGRAGTAQARRGRHPASSRSFARRAARTTGPGSVKHSSGARIAWAPRPPFWCQPAMGPPVVSPAERRVRLAFGGAGVPVLPWCACAWACCGCGPGRWPRWWPPSSHLAWLCCARWHGPPGRRLLPRSRLRAGLAADHLPARPGRRGCWYPDQPEPQRLPCRNAPRRRLATPAPKGLGAIIELARHWQAGGLMMEPHPGVFCSNVRTGEWEPDPEVPGSECTSSSTPTGCGSA